LDKGLSCGFNQGQGKIMRSDRDIQTMSTVQYPWSIVFLIWIYYGFHHFTLSVATRYTLSVATRYTLSVTRRYTQSVATRHAQSVACGSPMALTCESSIPLARWRLWHR